MCWMLKTPNVQHKYLLQNERIWSYERGQDRKAEHGKIGQLRGRKKFGHYRNTYRLAQ
jgi:hypothetical protein